MVCLRENHACHWEIEFAISEMHICHRPQRTRWEHEENQNKRETCICRESWLKFCSHHRPFLLFPSKSSEPYVIWPLNIRFYPYINVFCNLWWFFRGCLLYLHYDIFLFFVLFVLFYFFFFIFIIIFFFFSSSFSSDSLFFFFIF